jgi:inner membrane protein
VTGRTHDLAAITALFAVVLIHPPLQVTVATALLGILANQLGGIAPDIDEPTAPLWRNLPIGGVIGKGVGRLLGGHRFLTHSIFGAALFGILVHELLVFIAPIAHSVDLGLIWWAFMIGLLSHLVMDSFTKEGVPWLLPIPVKFGFPPLRAWRITTGKAVETLLVFPGIALIDVVWGARHYTLVAAALRRIVQ